MRARGLPISKIMPQIPATPPAIVSPAPSGTVCADGKPRFREARAVHVDRVQWPSKWAIGTKFEVNVIVHIDKTGHVTDAEPEQDIVMDPPEAQKAFLDAAVTAAKDGRYLPKVVNCEPVASMYIFHVTYNATP